MLCQNVHIFSCDLFHYIFDIRLEFRFNTVTLNILYAGGHGDCIIKMDHKSANARGRFYPTTTSLTVEACATACSDNEDCTIFEHSNYGENHQVCALFKSAEVWQHQPNTGRNVSSGICPKSQRTLHDEAIEDIPAVAPDLQCMVEHPKTLCHFPFLYQGEIEWDSLRDEMGRCKCSTEDQESATNRNTLIDHSSMDTLANCTPCSSGEHTAYCAHSYEGYTGQQTCKYLQGLHAA